MECVERNHQVELILKRQAARIGHFESHVGTVVRSPVLLGITGHLDRGIDADHRTLGQACGDLSRDLPISASYVQHAL